MPSRQFCNVGGMVSGTSGEEFMVSGFAWVNVRNDAYFLGY